MVASSLQGVIAQRLLRRNCENCAEPHAPTPQESAWLAAMAGEGSAGERTLRGRGCSTCNGTGCSGRLGVYELLELDAAMASAATQSDPVAFKRLAAEKLRGHTMVHHAFELVRQGRVSVAEAMRLSGDAD